MRFFTIFLIVISVFGADGLFTPCAEKNRLAYEGQGVAIDADRLIVSLGFLDVQTLPKDWNVTKYDPLTGLVIARVKHNKTPIVMRNADRIFEHKNLLYMNENEAVEIPSETLNRQFGAKLATTNRQLKSGALLTAPCYAVVGISALGATIESEFLRHFIDAEEGAFFWGDLGVRLDGFKVVSINPFEKRGFKIGDLITVLNGKTYDDPRELERAIALLKAGEEANVSIERKPAEMVVKVAARRGGFLYADTFLEGLGWLFDRDLFVRKIEEKPKLPINIGDRIVAVNGTFVFNPEDVRRVLTGSAGQTRLLMQRESFQFFITVNIE